MSDMRDRGPLLSTQEALVASCVIGWVFYWVAWILERPLVWNAVGKYVSRFNTRPKKELDAILSGMHIRAVGALHNTIQVLLSLYALNDPELWADTWHGVTPLTQWILIISAGFFLWDIAVSIRRASTDGPEFILHGGLCFAFYLYVTISRNFHFYGCGFLLWEVSTPFVHLRWFLYKIGKKDTKLYLYNGVLMMVVFGLCRICWGGYLGMRFLIASTYPQDAISSGTIWCLRGIWITLNCLNWYWFKQMVAGALRLMFKQPLHVNEKVSPPNGTTHQTFVSKKEI